MFNLKLCRENACQTLLMIKFKITFQATRLKTRTIKYFKKMTTLPSRHKDRSSAIYTTYQVIMAMQIPDLKSHVGLSRT